MLSKFENRFDYTLSDCLDADKEIRIKSHEFILKGLSN